MDIVIYGAQAIALGAYKAIKEMAPNRRVLCFLVSSKKDNPLKKNGLPVKELDIFASEMSQEEKDNIEVLIGTPENVMGDIENNLDRVGFHYHIRLNSQRWAEMQTVAFTKTGKFTPLVNFPIGYEKASLHVYKMICHKDSPLQNIYETPAYITSLQVGAARTDIRLGELADNTGNHISEKNGYYSELTGLYWIWKNRIQKESKEGIRYCGIAHYRRILDLTEDDLLRLAGNGIDVVLPYPMPYEPDIEEHHKRYLSKPVWNAVIQALHELHPENIDEIQEILKQEYMYHYNIILSKGSILQDYCEWLFPILFRVDEIIDSARIEKPNRFMGYVGETLETVYFMLNKKKYTIAHIGCKFLV